MSASEIVLWNDWACRNGQLVSPYLRFEFAETIARSRSDVRVAILEDENGLAGFFPHHAPCGGIVRPVGAPMSDYQGVVARPDARLDLARIVRDCGTSALVFDNWYCPKGGMPRARKERDGSVMVDLTDGADAYFQAQRALHKDHFKKTARRQRAAERDIGPVRVVLGDPKGDAFAQLQAWKSEQYTTTGKLDVFSIGWVQDVLENLRRREGQEFSGLTASLWFGDRLAAVEFGLVAGDIYHSWFPAYDPELSKYSPGLLLLHGLFEQAHERGLSRIDLGRGGAHYKKYYASYEVPLDQGRMLVPGLASAGIKGWEMAESLAGVMPERLANLPVRLRRRWSQVSAFQPRLAPRLASFTASISL
ncbi:GNAT family N-acetyltransferase [Maricaulis parjimensis]|uniref:GNAT family N-acetyltransferase n=1 Tax=Maricaulis parjimensis TaxID=144023 RepID=UPI00193AAB8A|nr:GNAT family N-acetyltransferase [Maricaulis parjimensis]